jgi:serine/threonine protein kinase/Tfp pilus assembly protein PilF
MQLAGAGAARCDLPEESAEWDPFPRLGTHFHGFEILEELGRGAMGRVFLARQALPTERIVVLKVGTRLSNECHKLAKLQHPNVVPVYSFHSGEKLQAVCMPYRGPLTLAHLVARLRSENLQTLDGKLLTTVISKCREYRQPVTTLPPVKPVAEPTAKKVKEVAPQTPAFFTNLRGLVYVDAILTIFRQAVDGLKAAHAERIVHCDLKPANVLLADDGNVQLIDFGVAFDQSEASRGMIRIGGTRPYMSPEQLHSIATAELGYDERSDLYAIGIMLYELLTGRLPFGSGADEDEVEAAREYERRFAPIAPVRELNPRVPHAVASIIAKCLAPKVADRYQTAAQLLEDLDRQIAKRPLRYAANTSKRELASKWAFRNRLVIASAMLLVAAGATFAAVAQRDAKRAAHINRLELAAEAEPFFADADEATFLFGMAERDPLSRKRAWEVSRRAFDRFGAWSDPAWHQREEFCSLDTDRANAIRHQVASMMLLFAHSRIQESHRAEGVAKNELLKEAADWNQRAEANHPLGNQCRAILSQRAYIAKLSGDPAAAERNTRAAAKLARTTADAVLESRQLINEGRYQTALALLKDTTQADTKSFWGVFYVGVCHQMLNQHREAIAAYDICLSLRPGFFGAHYNRAQARYRFGTPAEAEADFDRVLAARPEWATVHFERALTREALNRYQDALEDLNRALELKHPATMVYVVRSRVYGRLKETKLAEADFAKALETVPTDERGWLARGQAQVYRDPVRSLADYTEALKLNPRLVPALQGKAHLLSRAGKNAESAEVLTQIIAIQPDLADAWSGRGVLRARMKDREGALADAKEALRLGEWSQTKYQVAGIYALTSQQNPNDRDEAYSLLDNALRSGFGFDLLDKDRDLDGIRNEPQFQKIVENARKYRALIKKID